MLIKDLTNCSEFIAGDGSILREILRPDNVGACHGAPLRIRYSLAHATVKPDETTKPHTLKTSEVYYILEGEGKMHIDNESERVKAGQAIYIPPNSKQLIKNIGKSDLRLLCIVDPAWRKEDEVIF